jgi:hypothetical protein
LRERELYPKISELFRNDYHIFFEYKIPDSSRREIDILCVKKQKRNPELIAIETKISNWKKVISQAFTRLFYVDKSYIAIPQEYVNKVDREILEMDGIGLISVEGSAEIVVEAKKSKRTFKWRREMLLNDVMRRMQYENP